MLSVLIVLVAYAILLWRIFARNRVTKFNIHLDRSLTVQELLSDCQPAKFMRLQLIWRSAEKIPLDWDRAVLRALRTREYPITIELLGRKLTFVIDGRNQKESVNMGLGGIGSSEFEYNTGADSSPRFQCVKLVFFLHERDLEKADALGDVYAEKRNENASKRG